MNIKLIGLMALLLASVSFGQILQQTLPAGFEATEGSNGSNFPQNTANDQIWQWRYPASEFAATGPILITDIAMRSKAGFVINSFDFPDWRVTLAEAAAETAASLEPVFGKNLLRSKLVRQGPWTGGPFLPIPNATVGGFAYMGLENSFLYDPTAGKDFIVQIEKCGTNLAWGVQIDTTTGVANSRIGNLSSCNANTSDLNQSILPIISIRYRQATQTLPQGFDDTEANSSAADPVMANNDQKWQWHYDAAEFDFDGPMVITEIWVRPNAGAGLAAFNFPQFDVTLGRAATGYTLAEHSNIFGDNMAEQKLVRTGPWSGPGVGGVASGPSEWVAMQLQESFVYDPSLGQDLIVQIEKCGTGTNWSELLDARFTPVVSGVNGGNQYGHSGNCSSLFGNQASANELVPVVRIDFEPLTAGQGAINRFPWREDFDDLPPSGLPHGWHQPSSEGLNGNRDWILNSSITPSFDTGPTSDHTSGIGNYVYVEDSLTENQVVSLLSPVLNLSSLAQPQLSFWVHSRDAAGVGASFLSLDIADTQNESITEDVIPIISHLGTLWSEVTVDLSAFAGQTIRLRFRVNNDNGGFTHDIAIDDIRVYDPTFQIGQAPTSSAELDISNAIEAEGIPVTPGRPGPYTTALHFGESMDITIRGNSNQTFILFAGPLNVAVAVFPGVGQLDIGPNGLITVIDGSNGSGFIPGVFDTGPSGEFNYSAPWNLPPGLFVPFQAAVYTGGPSVIALSNAVVIESL